MTIEAANSYISDFNVTYPEGTADRTEADNHLRNIKNVLATTFPNFTGAMTATHTELSLMVGKTAFSSSDDIIDNMPATTRKPFYQAAAPTGWTQVTSADVSNGMLRVVSGTGGGNGGSVDPISHTHTYSGVIAHTHTFSTSSNGAHTHTVATNSTGTGTLLTADTDGSPGTATTSSDGAHTHSGTTASTGSSSQTTAGANSIKYINMIIAAKD